MSKSVFVALIEVKPLVGCFIDPRDSDGALVRCYVSSRTEEEAIERLTKTLEERRFEIVEVEWCVDFDQTDWEKQDDEIAAAFVREARESDDVVLSEFHTWSERS